MQDYSEWLTQERFKAELEAWTLPRHVAEQKKIGEFIATECAVRDVKTLLEVACGIAWLRDYLPEEVQYYGFDANPYCVLEAQRRSERGKFVQADIRKLNDLPQADMVVCIGTLRHFGVNELETVFQKILSLGKCAMFNVQIGPEIRDDGTEYHHVWITEEELEGMVERAGHRIEVEWCRACYEGERFDILYVTGEK